MNTPEEEAKEEFKKIKGSKLFKAAAKGEDPETEEHCKAVDMLVEEAMEQYESGEMSFSVAMKELAAALIAYASWEENETAAEEKKSHGSSYKK